MSASLPMVIHIYPASGGVAEYAKVISAIYKQQGVKVVDVQAKSDDTSASLLSRIPKDEQVVYHFEIGAGDSLIFDCARAALLDRNARQLVTIHDTGQFIRHPLDNSWAHSNSKPQVLAGKVVRKLLSITIGSSIRNRYLASKKVTAIYLRKDIAAQQHGHYLPQPMYHELATAPRKSTAAPKTIGFSGYWGKYKGLETIIQAWQTHDFPDLRLIVSGGTADATDAYATAIEQQLRALSPAPELPGFVQDLDTFLLSLSILLLPYLPELPSGTSAMALRAAELGVPIIASDIPALKEQLGDAGVTYIAPKSAESLAEAITSVTDHWSEAQQSAQQLSRRISTDHSWQTVGAELVKLLGVL